jgi:deoxyribodipyrimidine photo-lyase
VTRALVLFTRDLRMRDQPALAAAAREADTIVPAFVLDHQLLAGGCGAPNRVAFLLDSLRDLDRSLRQRGAQLVVRKGDVVEEALRLAAQWELSKIYMSADQAPYAQRREKRLAAACRRARIELRTYPGITVLAPGRLTPAGGDHYRVFTPYWRAWRRQQPRPLLAAPRRISTPPGLRSTRFPSPASLTSGRPSSDLGARRSPELAPGGESAARELLSRWLGRGLASYDALRDQLPDDGTSRLSPYLHLGCLSPATVLARSVGRAHDDSFARQLCWRDFHHQVLAARPDLPHADYRPRGDRWRRDPHALEAWQRGLTGYPIVDAGMRQLQIEGFMHNRARLIVASFLTKLLHIDWRAGAAHFAELLIDADVACNVGNWQWVAGTGNDTRPNRVLNPLRQAHRFDPHGRYVRRYLPELARIAGGAVHEPWRLAPEQLRGLSYPQPILDHVAAAAELRAQRQRIRSLSLSPSSPAYSANPTDR